VKTTEIVKVLRKEAWYMYYVFNNSRHPIDRRTSDALRRAAKRLSRLADDSLAAEVRQRCDNDNAEGSWGVDAYRARLTGGQG
jgi:hypothetical protein